MKIILIIAALLSISTLAFAEPEQLLDFKGLVLNSELADIENNPKYSCRDEKSMFADKICTQGKETIAGAPVDLVILWYYEGKLQVIGIVLKEEYFAQVVEALNEKYGQGDYKTEEIQNRMGATFVNKIYKWRKSTSTLEATRYAGKITVSSIYFKLDSGINDAIKRAPSLVKEKAKDL